MFWNASNSPGPSAVSVQMLKESCDDRGLKSLAAAMLVQAFDDLGKGPRGRAEVEDWLNGQRERTFSFDLCCKLLCRRPEDIRQRVFLRGPTRLASTW